MLLVFVIVFCALIALGFGAASAWSDVTRLTIPNLYAALIGAAFIPAYVGVALLAPDVDLFFSLQNHIFAAAIVFAVTYGLFFFKLIGGGDSKLLTVYALWTGLNGLMPLLFFMALVGGLLGFMTLVFQKNTFIEKPAAGGWIEKAQSGKSDVPYGVAIFIGAVVAFWQVGYLKPDVLMQLATNGAGG